MPTEVKLPTQLQNWPDIKKKLLALKANNGKVDDIVSLMDEAHDLMIHNFITAAAAAARRSFFSGLGRFLTDGSDGPNRLKLFATSTLPFIVDCVLALEASSEQLVYSCQQENTVTVISRSLVVSLLASMFLCLLPPHPDELRSSMSENHFILFFGRLLPSCRHQSEKLQCILSYFEQLKLHSIPKESMAFIRVAAAKTELLSAAALAASKKQLCRVVPETVKGIELADNNLLHVNFGNSFIGGGALQTGVLQEEVNFTIHPELLVSMAFMEAMDDNEAVLVFGYEQFSGHSGWAMQFKFKATVKDSVGVDACGFRQRYMLSIDAVPFAWCQVDQLLTDNLLRDINKAFVGFRQVFPKSEQLNKYTKKSVATGNWGCGAFGGHVQIKFFLQWLAASMSDLPLLQYHSFGDDSMMPMQDVVEKLQERKVTVGQLWQALQQCCSAASQAANQRRGEEEVEEYQGKLKVDMFAAVLNKIFCEK